MLRDREEARWVESRSREFRQVEIELPSSDGLAWCFVGTLYMLHVDHV